MPVSDCTATGNDSLIRDFMRAWERRDDGFIVDSLRNDEDLIPLAARVDVVVVDIGMLGSGT